MLTIVCCSPRCWQRRRQRPEGENHIEEAADIPGGVRQRGELHGEPLPHGSSPTPPPSCRLTGFLLVSKVFPDVGNNAAVISLLNGPVVEGDVKVMFESSAVSALPARSLAPSCSYTSVSRVCPKATKTFPSTSGSTPPSSRVISGCWFFSVVFFPPLFKIHI